MSILEVMEKITPMFQVAASLAAHVHTLNDWVRRLLPRPTWDYENVYLETVLDIRDPHGKTAVLRRRQRVQFREINHGIVRDLVWGEGKAIARYSVEGARKLGVRSEGLRMAILLGLQHRPSRGEERVIESRRVLSDAFRERFEYFEMLAERPTRRLSMRVVFPLGRAPKEARLVASPPDKTIRRLPVRYTPDRRAVLTWRQAEPVPFTTYSLHWSW